MPEPCGSSAAPPPGRRHFPPERWSDQVAPQVIADLSAPRNRNPPRRHRSYPRVVKRARHNSYRVKKTTDTGRRHTGPPTIRLACLTPPARVTTHTGPPAKPPRTRTRNLTLTA